MFFCKFHYVRKGLEKHYVRKGLEKHLYSLSKHVKSSCDRMNVLSPYDLLNLMVSSNLELWANPFEPEYRVSDNIASTPSEDSAQPSHPHNVIRFFVEHSMCSQGSKVHSGGCVG